MSYYFSSDSSAMDRDRVHRWISEQSYWAEGRSRELQDRAMDASLNFGMFDSDSGRQVAYARVVTDSATFAWLCDVFVDSEVRGHGVGVSLIEGVCDLLDSLHLKRVALATADAHGLYEKFGFAALDKPEVWMSRANV